MRQFILLFAFPLTVLAEGFSSPQLLDQGQTLTYVAPSGDVLQAPKQPDQVSFAKPKRSSDGQFLGWLAEYPNGGTSYPIPLTLVIIGTTGQIQTFNGQQAIFGWCYVDALQAVAFRQSALHGPSDEVFELHRLNDGQLLARFIQPWQDQESATPIPKMPDWATCAAVE